MKSTGIVRRIDELGRVVIPKGLRADMGVEQGDPLEIFVNGDMVIFRKYSPGCYLCRSEDDLHTFHGKQICTDCINRAAEMLK
ncbi:AbrB/MazE/SpoVT family DNA-binding domain-containing protein [Paenibacillus kribbensis]|uniref:AbrB/MazE/SpoVT family DNA-binding domain-containing protein n=1 Tax=Paenibacillus kribbensis TaxID=172713 RepID=UPI002DBD0D08|nr:AbrB/MazE/SpoVT family DNA-binding domain-containing protein [Paenibacillus kribbensis]MEC0234434.1 AbrB/MazE/SpoVT family DNA-binding domain-containing protein [Paenibacillus kribbensis]